MIIAMDAQVVPIDRGRSANCSCKVRADSEIEALNVVSDFLLEVRGDRKALMRAIPGASKHTDFATAQVFWDGYVRFMRCEEAGEIVPPAPDGGPVRYIGFGQQEAVT